MLIWRCFRSRTCPSYASPFSRAFWKIVGLLVTPTTCLVSTSSCRLPLRSRSRLMSSSQTETSWAERSASASVMVSSLRSGVLHCGMGGGDHPVGCEAELLEQHVALGARAEVFDRDHLACLADVFAPALPHG